MRYPSRTEWVSECLCDRGREREREREMRRDTETQLLCRENIHSNPKQSSKANIEQYPKIKWHYMSHEVTLKKRFIHINHTLMHLNVKISPQHSFNSDAYEKMFPIRVWIRDTVISALVSDYTGLFTHCPHLRLWRRAFAQPTRVHVCDFLDLDYFWTVYKHSCCNIIKSFCCR